MHLPRHSSLAWIGLCEPEPPGQGNALSKGTFSFRKPMYKKIKNNNLSAPRMEEIKTGKGGEVLTCDDRGERN